MHKVSTQEVTTPLEESDRSACAAGLSAPSQYPGVTSLRVINGLMNSTTDENWKLFRRDGEYWNYLVNFIRRSNIFRGRQDRVEESVMNAFEKIGKFMIAKRFKLREEGKGYFRGFLKQVTFNEALRLRQQITRQEQIRDTGSNEHKMLELDEMLEHMEKANARVSKRIEAAEKMPVNYNLADMFDFQVKISKADLEWVQKLQLHVLYLALGHVLSNEQVPAERRELLRLRYGMDMKPEEIYKQPRFASKSRGAIDTQMSYAKAVLRQEAESWWKLVKPGVNDFADETVLKLWRELARSSDDAELVRELQDKANSVAGRIN